MNFTDPLEYLCQTFDMPRSKIAAWISSEDASEKAQRKQMELKNQVLLECGEHPSKAKMKLLSKKYKLDSETVIEWVEKERNINFTKNYPQFGRGRGRPTKASYENTHSDMKNSLLDILAKLQRSNELSNEITEMISKI